MDLKPSLVVHHGGSWEISSVPSYLGGKINVFDNIPENVDSTYVKELVHGLGYNDIVKLHFLDPRKEFSNGIRFLSFESSICDPFIALLLQYRLIHIYTEHDVRSQVVHNLGKKGHYMSLLTDNLTDCPRNEDGADFVRLPRTNLPDVDYDTEGTDVDDDEYVNARDEIARDKNYQYTLKEELEMLKKVAAAKGLGVIGSDFEEFSEMDSPSESEDDNECGYLVPPISNRYKKAIKIREDNSKAESFFCGQHFDNPSAFKKAVRNHSIELGRNIPFTKNDKLRVGAVCEHKSKGFPWRIWASWDRDKSHFTVKSYISEHTCGRSPRVKKMSASWIAETYQNQFKVNPYMKLHDIMESIWLDWGIRVSRYMAYRARLRGQKLIIGEYKEQYALLPRYAEEILRSNRGNTVKLKLNDNVFDRIYICFEALRKGFLAGCRPFISLDGCFLKGPFGGQLLVAVGRDGNNQMFPLAWAVVGVESIDTWSWFLYLLANDLGTNEGAGYTIMSDQQKGLLAAVNEVFPQAETRVCARHVYCNFRSVFGGSLEFRKQFWIIAKSTTENAFLEKIEGMRLLSSDAADDLLQRNYMKWCRAFYTPMSCCDSVDNNMSEVFNAYILKLRHKPIITMLEDIREGLMERLHKKRDMIKGDDMSLCPRIQQQLEKHKVWARGWNAFWDGGFCYGVRDGATQTKYVVNLGARTCTCNAWQVSGIPCKHAVVAIWKMVDHPEQYVSDYFKKSTYDRAYGFLLEPLNGPQEWPIAQQTVTAPQLKKINHRPKTKRRNGVGEVTDKGKLRKTGVVMTCSLCGIPGHNKKGCKNAPKQTDMGEARPSAPATTTTPTSTSNTVPMHHRGVGLYTYPNGDQRIATPSTTVFPQREQPHRAFYSDYEGEQTIYSFSQEYQFSQSQSGTSAVPQQTISTQALQDQAMAKRLELTKKKD